MKCYYHPDRDAVAVCSVCKKPLCNECAHNVNGKIYCPDCFKGLSLDKAARDKSLMIVAIVIVVTAAIIFAMISYRGAGRFAPPVTQQNSSQFLDERPIAGETSLNVILEFGALKTLSIKTTSSNLYSVGYPNSADLTESFSNGTLTLKEQKNVPSIISPGLNNTLELYVSNKIPVTLNIKLGAGNIQIDSLLLSSDVTTIELGAGNIKLSGGDIKNLSVKLGAGNVTIDSLFVCNSIHIQNGVGSISLDLRTISSQCDASVANGVGSIDIKVPKVKGVKASIKSTTVSQSGFNKVDNSYFNNAYNTSGAQISIDVSSVGSVTLNED